MSFKAGFRIAARGLIVEDQRLLFVSNDEVYWYLPGGRLEGDESLETCVEREVYEETGLCVKTGSLQYVLECLDLNDQIHKINFYFQTTVLEGSLSDTWNDPDGSVQFRRFFDLTEIQQNKAFLPRFLASGNWCQPRSAHHSVYQGCVTMRGFEMVDTLIPEILV